MPTIPAAVPVIADLLVLFPVRAVIIAVNPALRIRALRYGIRSSFDAHFGHFKYSVPGSIRQANFLRAQTAFWLTLRLNSGVNSRFPRAVKPVCFAKSL